MGITKIVCPVDVLDEGDRRVLDYAVALATAIGARVTAIHVFDVPGYVHPEPDSSAARSYAERALSEHRERFDAMLAPLPEDVVDARLLPGVPHRRIAEEVASVGAQLVVMGTHSRRGLSRFFLGSIAERVVRTSAVPVLTVPRDPESIPMPPKSILVPHDLSTASRTGLELAHALRPGLHAAVSAVYVLEGEAGSEGAWIPRWIGPEHVARHRAMVERAIRDDVAEVFGPEDQVVQVQLLEGEVVDSVLQAQRSFGADLIIVGASGKDGVERILLGSYTADLLRRSEVPVLTVP